MFLTDLELNLSRDTTGVYKDQVLEELAAWREEMAQQLADPHAQQKLQENLLLRDGCAAAMRVVEAIAARLRQASGC